MKRFSVMAMVLVAACGPEDQAEVDGKYVVQTELTKNDFCDDADLGPDTTSEEWLIAAGNDGWYLIQEGLSDYTYTSEDGRSFYFVYAEEGDKPYCDTTVYVRIDVEISNGHLKGRRAVKYAREPFCGVTCQAEYDVKGVEKQERRTLGF